VEAASHRWSLSFAATAIASHRVTARALAEAQLARIAATDGAIGAWSALDAAHVRHEAERCDAAKSDAPLTGIGVGVKDIIATRTLPTEMGSPIFAGHQPAADAACIARLIAAGGYVFGKTVTTEFAFMHPAKTRNPWHAAHTPGGSSSGSAAAVAAGHVTGALGTQTNGSIIRPAAYCGVVGFKPTFGAIAFDGVNLFSESLDTLGTFTRTVADAARLSSAIADAGRIPAAAATLDRPPRLGYLTRFPWTQVESGALDTAVLRLRTDGAEIAPVELAAELAAANVVHKSIMLFEGARNLGPLQRRERSRLSSALNDALDQGRAIDERSYRASLEQRARAIATLAAWLQPFDAIITPPAPAGAPAGLLSTGDPSCCTLWSLAGFPALTLPIGRDESGLPLGMQLAGPADADAHLLSVASWCEERLPFVGLG
jgi:Asp-tRNA(Asn)/Glu-tRNA(Gln) amidotransferase A subunit family amidase